ncbi:AAA family ATPase [Saccharicrinis sp. FJH54]|uniref:AAA family ATPase n=1 Tax=Saccharicrinis sp. FJH54 TaxID=3344665 RepID=UPI0035D4694E
MREFKHSTKIKSKMRVNVLGQDTETPEYEKALVLKEMFEEWLSIRKNKQDEVMIIPNLRLYGEQISDLSVLIVARFDRGVSESLEFYEKNHTTNTGENATLIKERVYFSSFAVALTFRKEQPEQIHIKKDHIWVTSGNRSANMSLYSKDLSFSAKRFLSLFLGEESNPFVASIINFEKLNFVKHNKDEATATFVRGEMTLDKLLNALVLINKPTYQESHYVLNGFYNKKTNFDKIEDAVKYFSYVKNAVGPLTKQKLNAFSKTRKDIPQYYSQVGKELLILKGGAGTGKTMKLMQLAYEVFQSGNRCLILTYNRALVQDISRLLLLQDINDKPNEPTIKISTIHKFIRPILEEITQWETKKRNQLIEEIEEGSCDLGREQAKSINHQVLLNYLEFYEDHLIAANNNLINFNLQENDTIRKIQKEYDYVFIDEAQDWRKEERDVLFKIFGSENIVIADGMEQLVRTNAPLNWKISNGIRVKNHEVVFPPKSLRQKANLCEFQKIFALKFGTIWDVKQNENLNQGKIWVFNGELNKHMFGQLKSYTDGYSKDKYDDILFLAPSHLTKRRRRKSELKNEGKTRIVNETIERSFSLKEEWKKMHVDIHDLTYVNKESQRQPSPGEYRVISYESCRGLESFAVVALDMDLFFDMKFNSYHERQESIKQGDMFVQSFEDKAFQYASMWALIVFSRPVDLLLITIKNKNSVLNTLLTEINEQRPGLIQFIP